MRKATLTGGFFADADFTQKAAVSKNTAAFDV